MHFILLITRKMKIMFLQQVKFESTYLSVSTNKLIPFKNAATNLIRNGLDFAIFEKPGDLLGIEVADPDVLGEALLQDILHALPRIEIVGIVVEQYLAIRRGGEVFGPVLESHRPVDEVKVNVLELQLLQDLLQLDLDELPLVEGIPEFARDEEVLALDNSLGDFRVDGLADLLLVAIDVGAIDVPVANVDCFLYSFGYFARLRLKIYP
jgi:hypothetical protein